MRLRTKFAGCKIWWAKRDRTADLLHAMQALSQLSIAPSRKACRVDGRHHMNSAQCVNGKLQRVVSIAEKSGK